MARGVVIAAVAALFFAGCPAAGAQPPTPPAPIIPSPVQPANIGDLKRDAVAYHDSGAYLTNLQQAAAPAIAWINDEAPRIARPAVVLDIDETALSNWEAIKANDFGRVGDGSCDELPAGRCGWLKAPQRAQIEAQGYTIIANIGDQPSDLAGGFSQQTYLLPNPFYRIP